MDDSNVLIAAGMISRHLGGYLDQSKVMAAARAIAEHFAAQGQQPAVPEGWNLYANDQGVVCLEDTQAGESILVPTYSDRCGLWMRVCARFLRSLLSAQPARKLRQDAPETAPETQETPELRFGGVVEVCPECDIAGCRHIRERQSNRLSIWATQYGDKMPVLRGTREIAELNWHPEEGADLVLLVEADRVRGQAADGDGQA